MNNKLRKIIALLLAVLLLVPTFMVGCGSQSASDTKPAAVADDKPKAEEKKEEKKDEAPVKPKGTITVWGWEFVKKNVDTVMPDFKAVYPDIEVKFEQMQTADVYKKMLLALSSGEGAPDVAAYETSNLAQVVETEGLADLTAKVAPYRDKMNKFKWMDATKDGKIYAMPWDSGPVALFYRRDIFEKAGYPSKPEEVENLLKTWEDFYSAAKVIKEKTGAFMISESKDKSTNRNFEKLLWQQGVWYIDREGNPNLNSLEAVKAMTYIDRFVKEGLADSTEEWTQPWYDSFKNGKVATIPGAVWMGGFLSGWIAPDTKGKWGVCRLPAWQEGGKRTANDGGSNFVIPRQTKNFDAAWAFVEFYVGKEASHLKMYQTTDVFPSLETAYSDKFFDEEMEYYGGQKVRRLFADLVKEVPEIAYTKDYPIINDAMKVATQKIYLKNVKVEDALKEANEEVKAKIDK